ncbi:MAG: tRNA dihydrouridine synthase DusB [Deltaproteobacteria bacterium]|nr:MAG: tRNA dihydrouridine synthase DusB [Deltaproteobacteria bacterium]
MKRKTPLKIGNLELGQGLILAPMAGITDMSFRLIAVRFGADLVTSEMVSAEGLVRENPGTSYLLQSHPDEKPLSVQLFGSEPRVMAEAARMLVDRGTDIIDLNMGCPVPRIIRQGAGAVILKNIETVERILTAVRRAVEIPVTVKIRSGWDRSSMNAVEVARAAEASGVDAITLHPRTAKQGLSGVADWSLIAGLKRAVKIPVIGNGDVTKPEQVEDMKQQTGCDGVMIGRAAMGNPWIFQHAKRLALGEAVRRPTTEERLEVMLSHLLSYQQLRPTRPLLSGVRSRLMWYSKKLPGASRLRAELGGCRDTKTMIKMCESFFASLEEGA